MSNKAILWPFLHLFNNLHSAPVLVPSPLCW